MKTMKRMNKWIVLSVAACSAITAGCKDDEENYLVRETDTIQFSSNLASSQRITLRCSGAWRSVIPDDAQWLSTTPSEGVGTGEFEWITVSATHNRSAERTATIYLECGGVQYPITVTQADGKIIYGAPTVEGNLIEQEASSARLCRWAVIVPVCRSPMRRSSLRTAVPRWRSTLRVRRRSPVMRLLP